PLSIRLSAIVAERGEPHGCGERHCRAMDGPSMPAPRSDDGAKEPGTTRRDGLRDKRFWLFLPGPAIRRLAKVTRPGGRNLTHQATSERSLKVRSRAKRKTQQGGRRSAGSQQKRAIKKGSRSPPFLTYLILRSDNHHRRSAPHQWCSWTHRWPGTG